LDLAARWGLCSVELPLDYVATDENPAALADFAAQTRERSLGIVVDGPVLEIESFRRHLEQAHSLGASIVRCMLSNVLCGDRKSVGGLDGWRRHLDEMARRLAVLAPIAADLGLRIGVENHQDATSDELAWLCETVGSPAVGVTLDTGNPLAVAEDPVLFAHRILPYLVHVHLKDYRITPTPHGYRIVHCPVGAGVVDFPALFALFRSAPQLTPHIEMAWVGERHIRILDAEWWAGFAPRPIAELLPILRAWRAAEIDVEWRTPWELGEDDVLHAWEMARLEESVQRMAALVS
jgi:sugar phosphate isomerase/epimerase